MVAVVSSVIVTVSSVGVVPNVNTWLEPPSIAATAEIPVIENVSVESVAWLVVVPYVTRA
ncbi:hypothetical protein D3C83_307430 [compost metagenome]